MDEYRQYLKKDFDRLAIGWQLMAKQYMVLNLGSIKMIATFGIIYKIWI
jgi:hypothetical protein